MIRLDRRGGIDPALVLAIVVLVGIAAVVAYSWWKSRVELEKMTLYPEGDGGKCIVIDTRKYPNQKIWRKGNTIVTETVWYETIEENVAMIWFSLEPPLERKIIVQFKIEGEAVEGYVEVGLYTFGDYKPVQWYWLCACPKYIERGIWYTVELRKDGGSVEPEIPYSIYEPEPHYPDRKPDALLVSVDYPDKPIRIYVRILYRD